MDPQFIPRNDSFLTGPEKSDILSQEKSASPSSIWILGIALRYWGRDYALIDLSYHYMQVDIPEVDEWRKSSKLNVTADAVDRI